MSYTTAHEEGPGWMNRLPRITSASSRSQARSFSSETEADELKLDLPPGTLPPTGIPKEFLRRQKEEDTPRRQGSRPSSIIPRRRKKKQWDEGHGPGGPISESAIYPQRRPQREDTSDTLTPGGSSPENANAEYDEKNEGEIEEVKDRSRRRRSDEHKSDAERHPEKREVYAEGDDIIIENEDGDVIVSDIQHKSGKSDKEPAVEADKETKEAKDEPYSALGFGNLKKKLGEWRHRDEDEAHKRAGGERKRGPALAYQFGNTIIVEDEDGEVVKTYELPSRDGESSSRPALTSMSTWTGMASGLIGGRKESVFRKDSVAPGVEDSKAGSSSNAEPSKAVRQGLARMGTWGWGGRASDATEKKAEDDEEDDDRHIRFTIGGASRRLTKADFIKEIQSMDPKARAEAVEASNATSTVKAMATDENRSGKSPSSRGRASRARDQSPRSRGERHDDSGEETDSEHERMQAKSMQNVFQLSRKKDVPTAKRNISPSDSTSDIPETEAERKRREQVLKGVADDDEISPVASSSSSRGRPAKRLDQDDDYEETPAERRRREAALGLGGGDDSKQEDSDDDDTPRVPPPAVKPLRGIRFAESPVRGKGKE